jgi:hypothetical protein
MTSKYLKKCSLSSDTMKMKIKTILIVHLTAVRMAIIKNKQTKNQRSREKWAPIHSCWECKLAQPLWKSNGTAQKTRTKGLKVPSTRTPVLQAWSPEFKPQSHKKSLNYFVILLCPPAQACIWMNVSQHIRDTCTPIFTAALFTMVKIQKQFRWSLTDDWITKMWHSHTHTIEYYLGKNKNEIAVWHF